MIRPNADHIVGTKKASLRRANVMSYKSIATLVVECSEWWPPTSNATARAKAKSRIYMKGMFALTKLPNAPKAEHDVM